ncbi:hypothetical protein Q4534_04355 [Cyclobacterium sp. 1_MG-2023]|uniref:hypothetical protein n=1 Tax=Cyclobacterium sp. 1_MG-2023 TaxID=3062681 RepID=UPI0026E40669|nr:hypothetical protein [Cyclobacterium sp. 1_MG-2023]MDO6436621.1 hypothetical protein [Cyclobacterium sp. 1_MG-2023]
MINIRIISFLVVFLISCKRNDTSLNNDFSPTVDSVDITTVVKKKEYHRFNFQGGYRYGIFYVFVAMLGDFYAIQKNGNILWEKSLNKAYGNSDLGPSILTTSTEEFHLYENQIYFLQNDNSVIIMDYNGDIVSRKYFKLESRKKVKSMTRLNEEELILLWINISDKYEYGLTLINLNNGITNTINKIKLNYPALKVKISSVKNKIYIFEDINNSVRVFTPKGEELNGIELDPSKYKNYEIRGGYDDGVISYRAMSKFERNSFLNDFVKNVSVTSNNNIYIHHHIYQRDSTHLPFKGLISVKRNKEATKEVILDKYILNFDSHGNYFTFVNHEKKVFIKVAPIVR